MPRAVLDAMALARPVAATPTGGVTDLILDGVTGLLFDVEDDEGLAACVDRLVRDEPLARRLGETARRNMRENFRPDAQTVRALEMFRRIASSHGEGVQ